MREEVPIHRLSGCDSWDEWRNLLNIIDRVNRKETRNFEPKRHLGIRF